MIWVTKQAAKHAVLHVEACRAMNPCEPMAYGSPQCMLGSGGGGAEEAGRWCERECTFGVDEHLLSGG